MRTRTASVIGSGPNGLAAALTLALSGVKVTVYERSSHPGGGISTSKFGPAGFVRDDCSAVHPLVLPSLFFRAIGISETVPYLVPEISYAQALEPGRSVLAYRDIRRTAAELGRDGPAWLGLLQPLSENIDQLADLALKPLVRLPQTPLLMTRFGLRVLEQAGRWGSLRFKEKQAPALLAGALAHGSTRLPSIAASAAGLTLAATAHAGGWPLPLGGAQVLADDLVSRIQNLGGDFRMGHAVGSLAELSTDIVIADVSAKSFLELSGNRGKKSYVRALRKQKYGQGIAKIDLALNGPVPWADPRLAGTPTIHIGGLRADVERAENISMGGGIPEKPFVMVVQPSVIDPSRAPEGSGTLWAYMRAPHGSDADFSSMLLDRIDEYAPGIRNRIVDMKYTSPRELEAKNPNYVGGDIASGQLTFTQLLARPVFSANPWRTGIPGVYLASAATVPGPGVHGMSGYGAALAALRDTNHKIATGLPV